MILLCLLNCLAPPVTSSISSIPDCFKRIQYVTEEADWYYEPGLTPSPVGTPSYGPKDFEREVAEEEEVDAAVLASLEHGVSSQQPGFCLDDDDDCTQRPCVVVDDDDDDGVATQLLPEFDDVDEDA